MTDIFVRLKGKPLALSQRIQPCLFSPLHKGCFPLLLSAFCLLVFVSFANTFKISRYAPEISTNIENLFLTAVLGGDFSIEPLSTWKSYASDINREHLETQLTILKMHAHLASTDGNHCIQLQLRWSYWFV